MSVAVVCTTLLIEKSPQALPLGAACIASAVKNWPNLKDKINVNLKAFSLEDDDLKKLKSTDERAEYIANKLYQPCEKLIVCFSCFVWNVEILRQAAAFLKTKGAVTIAGGPEITAHPSFYKDFDYTVSGEGEVSVPELISKILNTSEKSDKVIISQLPELSILHSPYLDGIIDPSEYEGALWELARGCPFKCAYCYESKGAKTVRLFPMERIKAELDLFARKKIQTKQTKNS